MRDVSKIKWYMLLLRRKTFWRSKQRQNHLLSLNVSLICSVYSRFLSLDHWPGDVSDIQFQTRNSQGRSFFLSKIALYSCFLPVFSYCSLSLIFTYHLLPSSKSPSKKFYWGLFVPRPWNRFIFPLSLGYVAVLLLFPTTCGRPLGQYVLTKKNGVFILRQKKFYG